MADSGSETTRGELADPSVRLDRRADGSVVLASVRELPSGPPQLGAYLRQWAGASPDAIFLAERDAGGAWRVLTYAAARRAVDSVSQALLDRGHGGERPVAALGDNSIDLAVLKLAAMQVGIPFLPISPGYSTMSKTLEKLRGVVGAMRPSLIYAPAHGAFARALAALKPFGIPFVFDRPAAEWPGSENLGEWSAVRPGPAVDERFSITGPDSIAKILLTSGSTGTPKGVINTHRMMIANGCGTDQVWPFLSRRRPVLVDWLPWNHTFGTNFNFNQILRHGGTMYIDAGRPVAGRFEETLRNLREVRPTLLYNVPRGFDLLVPALEREPALARHVLSDLDAIFFAGAALPKHLWERLRALSIAVRGAPLPILSALGSTETAPAATLCHTRDSRPDSVGLPLAGVEVKLLPNGGKLEMRVRGPIVTPGYYRDPERSAAAFDEEGFFKLGDAVKFADPAAPEKGLVFDGRVSENFKLTSGTWVHVGALRLAIIAACAPLVADAVVAGHDRDRVAALLLPNADACRAVAGAAPDASLAAIVSSAAVRGRIERGLAGHNAENPGGSTSVGRAAWLLDPLSIDAGEITDKGYINQRAVVEARAAVISRLFEPAPGADVIAVPAGASGGDAHSAQAGAA